MTDVWTPTSFSEKFEAAEHDLTERVGCIRELVGDTAAATSALSCGTNDRNSNELRYALAKGGKYDW